MSKTAKANTDAFYEKGLTDKFPFTTLLKNEIQKSWNNTWYPIPAEKYRSVFKIDITVGNNKALLNNISYNMQYLEFLEKEFSELEVSSVIYVMLVKTYVITSAAIVEGLFTNLIKTKGWTLDPAIRKEKNIRKNSFVEKIAIIEEQCNKNGIDASIIPTLDSLRNLRNRIHLHKNESITDHDYNTFDEAVKTETGKLMYEILRSSEISTDPECFEFLKVNLDSTKQK